MTIKTKADSLADKMNKLNEKFNLSEEMTIVGEDIEGYVQDKIQDIDLYESIGLGTSMLVNLESMVQDFKYVRDTLKETTDNGRKVLKCISNDLLNEDDEDSDRASLVESFAALNKAVGDNMKLYMQSYKDISTVLINIEKLNEIAKKQNPAKTVGSGETFEGEVVSTSELLKQLSGEG